MYVVNIEYVCLLMLERRRLSTMYLVLTFEYIEYKCPDVGTTTAGYSTAETTPMDECCTQPRMEEDKGRLYNWRVMYTNRNHHNGVMRYAMRAPMTIVSKSQRPTQQRKKCGCLEQATVTTGL